MCTRCPCRATITTCTVQVFRHSGACACVCTVQAAARSSEEAWLHNGLLQRAWPPADPGCDRAGPSEGRDQGADAAEDARSDVSRPGRAPSDISDELFVGEDARQGVPVRRFDHLAWADMISDPGDWEFETHWPTYTAEGPGEDTGPEDAETAEVTEQSVERVTTTLADLWAQYAPAPEASGAAASAETEGAAVGASAAGAAEPPSMRSGLVHSAARAAETRAFKTPGRSAGSGAPAGPMVGAAKKGWDDWTTAQPMRVRKGPESGGTNCPLGIHTDRNRVKKEKKLRRQAVSDHECLCCAEFSCTSVRMSVSVCSIVHARPLAVHLVVL